MIASTMSLKRLAERKLRRWGINPIVRGDSAVMLCQTQKYYMALGDFFTVFNLETEICAADKGLSINTVLNNRIKKFDNAFEKYEKHLNEVKKEKQTKREDAAGEFEDVLKHIDKIQVQVK